MSDDDLSNIEQKLGVTLPPAYRRLMLVRGAVLRASEVDHLLWASADRVVQSNLGERDPRGGTAGAYPQWWETYLLIGDNGDCEFFCLRLDGDAAVYKIGSDDGGPERVAKSLAGYQRTKCVRERLHPVPEGAKVACPCCGHLTLCRPKNWEECPVCLWHDDGRREKDADKFIRAGLHFNSMTTLTEARANYKECGVFSWSHHGKGRNPSPEETPK